MRSALPLVAALLIGPAAAQTDDAKFVEEFRRGVRLVQEGKHADGIAAFERCLAIRPNDAPSSYNIACAHSLAGDRAKAIEWLGKAAERGFDDVELAEKTDRDLDPVRKEPAFAGLLEKIRANAAPRLAREEAARSEAKVPWIHEPPGYDRGRPTPLLVALHGARGNKADFGAELAAAADEGGFLLLSLQGTLPVPDGGFVWYPSETEYRNATGKFETPILEAVRQARKERQIDPERIYLVGFSQGAFMAVHTALRAPGLFRGAVGIAGFYQPTEIVGGEGLKAAAGRGSRIYLIAGEKDRANFTDSSKRAVGTLQAVGVKAEIRTLPIGHELPPAADRKAVLADALRWLDANAPPRGDGKKDG